MAVGRVGRRRGGARAIIARLRRAADPARAAFLPTFFKTGPGQYGEGDRFLGLSVPQIRQVAREHHDLAPDEVEALLESPWHEARLLALVILTERYPRATPREQAAIVRLYLRRRDRINNWDLVDVSAPGILGAHLLTRPRGLLRRLAASRRLWDRRIAMVATQQFIRHGQYDDTMALATRLFDDPEDLMHKAVGWMLREVGHRDERVLRRFLDRHATSMPRTALRYAIEKLPVADRRRYLHMKEPVSRRARRGPT